MITLTDIKEHWKEFKLRPSLDVITGKRLVGCEVGCDVGNNALSMLENMPISELHLVDSFSRLDKYNPHYLPYGECKERLSLFTSKVTYHIGDSDDSASDFTDAYFDFVYIDGDHSFAGCLRDIKAYWPKVKVGGYLMGHDYNMQSVKDAVDRFFGKQIDFEGMDWWIKKEAE